MEEVINQKVWICFYLLITRCSGSQTGLALSQLSSDRWRKRVAFIGLLIPPCSTSCADSASKALSDSAVQPHHPAGAKITQLALPNCTHCPLFLQITRGNPHIEYCSLNWLENSVFSPNRASLLATGHFCISYKNGCVCGWDVWTIMRNFPVCLQSPDDTHTIQENQLGECENISSLHAPACEGRR